ncbi:MAG: zinc-ribbon domain-containing protein [Pyrinomonadaceae bacterium]
MFCPKCGIKNPDDGKFCRSCGVDLGNVSDVLSGKLQIEKGCTNSKGKRISLESSLTKLFMGIAFLAISIVLGATGAGRGWWFWMLIPALMFIGGGIAQFIQVRSVTRANGGFSSTEQIAISGNMPTAAALPPAQTMFVAPESRYRTGDLVPPSVTDGTTRHLEMNAEGETMALPKK